MLKKQKIINAKLKMYKNANSKCTNLAKSSHKEYTPHRRWEDERKKGHFREGETFDERKIRYKDKLLRACAAAKL